MKDSDRADQRVVLDHRHDEQCPRPAELDACNGQRITLDIGLIRTIAGDVDGLARFDEPAQRVERTRPIWPAPEEFRECRRYAELRDDPGSAIVGGRAGVMSKLEKPSAIEQLDAVVELSDAVMVARGDLGVETPPEEVPPLQRQIVRTCRKLGKPSIVRPRCWSR